jgi:hypothetical protein
MIFFIISQKFCITYSKPTYLKVKAYDFHSTAKTFRAAVLSIEKLKGEEFGN